MCLCLAGTVLLPALLCSTPPLLLLFSSALDHLLLSIAMCTALYSVCSSAPPPFLSSWPVDPQTNEQDSHFLHSMQSFSIFCIQYHFLNSMQYFSFENFLCIASNFSAMYNHNRRLVLAKKLLSYNNKNKICCILTKQCIYYLLHPPEK